MFRTVFSLSGFNRGICIATGFAGGYAFTNPDVDNVYDLFPLQKPPPFAFINVYKVAKEDQHDFEEKWRDLARFQQRQEGYLYTKLHRADPKDGRFSQQEYDYIDITQWTTGDAFRRSSLRQGYKQLVDVLPGSCSQPMMFSTVVNDTPARA